MSFLPEVLQVAFIFEAMELSKIQSLPPELQEMMCENLARGDRVSLAVSCRGLYESGMSLNVLGTSGLPEELVRELVRTFRGSEADRSAEHMALTEWLELFHP